MKIVVACGSGVATSTVIASKIEELLHKNNLEAQIIQCTLHEVESNLNGTTLVVSSMPGLSVPSVPVIVAFPYITGVGVEELDEKILAVLKA
jgi:PTS system galactitol-specific IIB component